MPRTTIEQVTEFKRCFAAMQKYVNDTDGSRANLGELQRIYNNKVEDTLQLRCQVIDLMALSNSQRHQIALLKSQIRNTPLETSPHEIQNHDLTEPRHN